MENTKSSWFRSWLQPYYVKDAADDLRHFVDLKNTDLACQGLPKLKAKPLDNEVVVEYLSGVYTKLMSKEHIQMDFQEFLLDINDKYYYQMPIPRVNRSRWDTTNCEFRGHSKYVKNIEHLPKEPIDNSWQIETHHKKDKAKHGAWSFKRKKIATTIEERSFRRNTKRLIKNEDWDALGDDWQQDSWLWD